MSLGAGVEGHGDHRLGDQLRCVRREHVHAEDAVGGGVGDHLDHAFGLSGALGAAAGEERERAFPVCDAGGIELGPRSFRPTRSPGGCR